MLIEDLKRHKLFTLITAKEQTFLINYLESDGDMMFSVKAAFNVDGQLQILNRAKRLQSNTIVRTLLTAIDGQAMPSREEIVQAAWQLYLTADSETVKRDSLTLAAEVSGLKTPADGTPDVDPKRRAGIFQEIEGK